jgi:succinate-acetate transporter protein|tara:strand:+ start:45097 stop:45327 length:231 start_codon:yes stop_codon:yes gene_type:complete
MSDEQPLRWSEEQLKRRKQRNIALALVLIGLVVLFFVVTIAKLGGNVAKRPSYGSLGVIEQVAVSEHSADASRHFG